MSTRARKQNKSKKLKYVLLALLGLASVFAYTMHYNSENKLDIDQLALAAKHKPKTHQNQELLPQFAQRWEQTYADVENYLIDDGFKKTRYFFDGYNVAANDEFILPTEETGAGFPKQVQNLNEVIGADMMFSQPLNEGGTLGGVGSGGGGMGGGAIGGGGRGRGERNRPQYVAKTDLDPNGTSDQTGGDVSAVPAPPAIWLLGSAFIGFIGLRRKQSVL